MSDKFLTILAQIPNCVFWKDLDSVYLGGNHEFARVIGLSLEEISGKTEADMPWAKTHGQLYRARDLEVIEARTALNFVESQLQINGKWVSVVVNKAPLFDETGQMKGIIGSYTYKELPQPHLSRSQLICLTHIANAKTAKQIAKEMNLSFRTVEFYIEILKKKLGCGSKSELIKKACLLGIS